MISAMTAASHMDYALLSLCLYREAVGDGPAGMTAVGCVVRNRANNRGTTFYAEVVRRLQFSSITDPKDPQLTKYPSDMDPNWKLAQDLASGIILGVIADVTNGSTMYYAPKSMGARDIDPIPIQINGVDRVFPKGWDRKRVKFQMQIQNQLFFTEV